MTLTGAAWHQLELHLTRTIVSPGSLAKNSLLYNTPPPGKSPAPFISKAAACSHASGSL